jgi:molecular chaperone HscB
MNYFELFGLPVAPSVDRSTLSKTYFDLQKKYHPDFFSNAGDMEKDEVLHHSAAVNKAYKVFQDPERTIEYFLQHMGLVETDEKYSLPPDFLMEMMEINEALTEDEAAATRQVNEYAQRLTDEVKPIIEHYPLGVTDGADLQKLKAYYYKKKYLQRILDRLAD